MSESIPQTRPTLSDTLRLRFKHILDPIGQFLNRMGIAPNTLTLMGLVGNFIGALFLAQGKFVLGGVILFLMGPLDVLDGTMARLRGEPSAFGAFVDSVTDRYSELFIYGGLIYFYLSIQSPLMVLIAFTALGGSFMVSYVRGRAQSLGYEAKQGILTRMERFAVLISGLLFGFPDVAISIIAVLANITALQRIIVVRRQAR
ncbi:MAG: CDP-alcohol phosphatidyltransferase family protein [Anaerolineales bacterium]|nr:MAG: CDP-alcohol phosphatidyltransferase family protein [Anaerolineales bacterium]